MQRISLDEARKNFEDVLNLVCNAKQRYAIRQGRQDLVAFVPLEDLELLERLDAENEVKVEKVDAAELLKHLYDDITLVASGKERIVIRSDGEEVATLVPRRDLDKLENLDNRINIEAAKRLLQRGMMRAPDDEEDD